jgi:hypothetical protein
VVSSEDLEEAVLSNLKVRIRNFLGQTEENDKETQVSFHAYLRIRE